MGITYGGVENGNVIKFIKGITIVKEYFSLYICNIILFIY